MTSWWGHQSMRTLLIPFIYPYPSTTTAWPQQSGSAAPAVGGLFERYKDLVHMIHLEMYIHVPYNQFFTVTADKRQVWRTKFDCVDK